MIQIDSESGNEREFAEYMVSLGHSLGLKTSIDKYNNVYIFVDGVGKPIMFNTHMDTVKPGKGIKPTVGNGYIYTDGTTVLGADSKSGIAALVESITILKEKNISHRPFVITLTCNEESGIPTADKIRSKVDECIVPDRGTPLGEVIIEAPFAQVFEVDIKGKSSYATTQFEKGRHAILAAVNIINSIPVGNFDNHSTSNIGIINGGIMTTTVPDRCYLKGNCYSFEKSSIEDFINQLESSVKKVDKQFGTKTKITYLEYFPGYKLSKNDPLVKYTWQTLKAAGVKPRFKTYKAVNNANLLNSVGIKSLTISTGGENQHTVNEKIKITVLEDLVKIFIAAVRN